jgi:hypothetical protein
MAKQPPPSQQTQEQRAYQKPQERPAERPAPQQTEAPVELEAPPASSTIVQEPTGNAKRKPAMDLAPQKVTAGRAGQRNIVVEKIPVPVGYNIPCRFDVTTLAGNELEVQLEQTVYRKSFTGQGKVMTTVIPVAPIGTKGKLIARDLTTGEVVEQPWTWHLLSEISGLWAMIRRLLGLS